MAVAAQNLTSTGTLECCMYPSVSREGWTRGVVTAQGSGGGSGTELDQHRPARSRGLQVTWAETQGSGSGFMMLAGQNLTSAGSKARGLWGDLDSDPGFRFKVVFMTFVASSWQRTELVSA